MIRLLVLVAALVAGCQAVDAFDVTTQVGLPAEGNLTSASVNLLKKKTIPKLKQLLGSEATGTPSFRCYQCRVANNEDCHEGYLRTCPTDQAYDVCLTMVVKNEQQGFYIEKKCALGPCNLRDEKQSQGLGLDTCDRSKDSYSCFECCKGDGCNTNSAPSLRPALALFGLASVTLILVVTKARRA